MVSIWSILAMFFSMIVPIGGFVALLIIFQVRCKAGMKPVLIGAGVFLVAALILEGLFNRFILVWCPPTAAFFKNQIAMAIYGALAAGIFEESGRLAGFKLFLKDKCEWKHGIAYGFGHGGLEMIVLGGVVALTQVNYVIYSIMINGGTFDTLVKGLEKLPGASAQLTMVKQQLLTLPSWEYLMGGIERIDALATQLALSLIVLYAVSKRKYIFYALAALFHFIFDLTCTLGKAYSVPIPVIELCLTIYAAAAVIFIIKSRKLYHPNIFAVQK